MVGRFIDFILLLYWIQLVLILFLFDEILVVLHTFHFNVI